MAPKKGVIPPQFRKHVAKAKANAGKKSGKSMPAALAKKLGKF